MKINQIKLSNVRGFGNLDLSFINPNNKKPLSTVILVGKNGTGKSTILKSIVHCLTLYNSAYGGELFDSADIRKGHTELEIKLYIEYTPSEINQLFNKDYLLNPSFRPVDTLRVKKLYSETGGKDGRYFVPPFDNAPFKKEYHYFRNRFISLDFDGGYIFYFDPFRFLPKTKVEGPNLLPLHFNIKENSLASSVLGEQKVNDKFLYIKQWLINLDFKRLKNPSPENESTFEHVIEAFNTLFNPYTFNKINDNGEILFQYLDNIIEIDKLSDGFKSVFIIIGEMLYRLTSIGDPTKAFSKEAIILIDEIDCHLHPKWQLNIIPSLKQLFPNCQIIATTHSPFIIESVQPYEVFKLEEDEL